MTASSWRVPLDSSLTPAQVYGWLGEDAHAFVLSGEWLCFAGAELTIIGSQPLRVAAPEEDPFELLGRGSLPGLSGSADGPAQIGGGWVGWLGYGLGSTIEALPPPPPARLAQPSFALAYYDHLLIHDGRCWWFEALLTPERLEPLAERLELWRARLTSERLAKPAASLTPFRARGGGAGHLAAVADCRERIAAGELFQANLTFRLEARIDGEPATLFGPAVAAAQPRFGALMDGLLSLSPERFLRRQGRTVWAEPIKGTRPRVGDQQARSGALAELEDSAKDAAEHVMIVDLMRNDLGRVCEYGSVETAGARSEPHAGVWHLVSTVSGRLRPDVDDGQLLRASFPPGSVTGAPKVQAMKVISALEASARGVYTGAVGIASPIAGLDLSVAIRTFEVGQGRISLGVGGGVVADSEPELELAEALAKAAGPLAAIGATLVEPAADQLAAARDQLQSMQTDDAYSRIEPALNHGHHADISLGLYETLLVQDDQPVQTEEHLLRLAASYREVYGREFDLAPLRAMVPDAAARCGGVRTRLRIELEPDGETRVITTPAGERSLATVMLVPYMLPGGIGGHKWRDRSLIETLTTLVPGTMPMIVDSDGTVLEVATANIWIREGEALLTPPLDGRILPGVTREALLAGDPNAREQSFDLARLARADEIFLTSSVAGRRPAALSSTPSE